MVFGRFSRPLAGVIEKAETHSAHTDYPGPQAVGMPPFPPASSSRPVPFRRFRLPALQMRGHRSRGLRPGVEGGRSWLRSSVSIARRPRADASPTEGDSTGAKRSGILRRSIE